MQKLTSEVHGVEFARRHFFTAAEYAGKMACTVEAALSPPERCFRANGDGMVKSTRDESSRPLSGGFTGITSVRAYKNCNADLLKEQERIRQIV
jgi:hypothetical protein